MKANEFIKKYGIDTAKEFYKHIKNIPLFSFNQDKPAKYEQFLESHELVKNIGGLARAKKLLNNAKIMDINELPIQRSEKWLWITLDKLEIAIADVENCQ